MPIPASVLGSKKIPIQIYVIFFKELITISKMSSSNPYDKKCNLDFVFYSQTTMNKNKHCVYSVK